MNRVNSVPAIPNNTGDWFKKEKKSRLEFVLPDLAGHVRIRTPPTGQAIMTCGISPISVAVLDH